MPDLVPGIHVLWDDPRTWMAGTSPAMTANDNGSSPERTEPEAEREWRRRIIRIWPVVIRPRVVIGIRPVVRTIAVAVVTAVIRACPANTGIRIGLGVRCFLTGRRWFEASPR